MFRILHIFKLLFNYVRQENLFFVFERLFRHQEIRGKILIYVFFNGKNHKHSESLGCPMWGKEAPCCDPLGMPHYGWTPYLVGHVATHKPQNRHYALTCCSPHFLQQSGYRRRVKHGIEPPDLACYGSRLTSLTSLCNRWMELGKGTRTSHINEGPNCKQLRS